MDNTSYSYSFLFFGAIRPVLIDKIAYLCETKSIKADPLEQLRTQHLHHKNSNKAVVNIKSKL